MQACGLHCGSQRQVELLGNFGLTSAGPFSVGTLLSAGNESKTAIILNGTAAKAADSDVLLVVQVQRSGSTPWQEVVHAIQAAACSRLLAVQWGYTVRAGLCPSAHQLILCKTCTHLRAQDRSLSG